MLALSALLCWVNWIFTGKAWFLSASFKFIREAATTPNYFADRSMSWLPYAVWLAIPFLVFLGCLNRLRLGLRDEGQPISRFAAYFPVQLIALVLLFIGHEVKTGTSFLLPWFYASQLIPATFLALGALLAGPIGTMPARRYSKVVVFTAIAALVPPALIALGYPLDFPGIPPMIWIVPLCIAAAIALSTPSPRASRIPFFLVLFLLIEYAAVSGFREELSMITFQKEPDFVRQTYLGKAPRFVKPYGERLRAYKGVGFNLLLAIHDAVRNIQEVDPTGHTFFWFGFEEPDGVMFNNIACTYTWGIRILNLDFPSLNDDRTIDHKPVEPGMKILVLSNKLDVAGIAQLSLRRSGFASKVLAVKIVRRGTIAFSMTFLEVGASTKPATQTLHADP